MEDTTLEISQQAKMICEAIRNKRRMAFIYHDKERIAEPQCCGITTADKEAVRMHMIKGGSRPEQLFDVNQLESLKILEEQFSRPGPNYKKNDSAMKVVYCQL
jgi:hypothetical protein